MAEESDDDEDGTSPRAGADEPELIDMASAPRMSNLERWIALRLVCGAGPRQRSQKIATYIASHRLSVVSRVGCLVCGALACLSTS